MIKRIISVLLLAVMLTASLPVGIFAEEIRSAWAGESAVNEQIYYTDLFYTYPYYLTSNTYLTLYRAETSAFDSNVLSEYVTTDHFKASVISQVLDNATEPSSVVKYILNNMNYQDFVYQNELDMANRLFMYTLNDNDITKGMTDLSKNASEYTKNFSKLPELTKSLKVTGEALENVEGIEAYSEILDVAFDFLSQNMTALASKLDSVKEVVNTKLGEGFVNMGNISDAMDFACALAVTAMAQEAQLQLVNDIISVADKNSMLYSGMVRLKGQLEGGFFTFFNETYFNEAVFDKVIKLFSKGIMNELSVISPGTAAVATITAVVDTVNVVLFKWILGANYEAYISAVLLADYKRSLADCVDTKAASFNESFKSADILAYDRIFNAYIAVNSKTYELFCELAKHNATYDTTYAETLKGVYDGISYYEYMGNVKMYVDAIPLEARVTADKRSIVVDTDTSIVPSADTVDSGVIYCSDKGLNASVEVKNGSRLTFSENSNVVINDNLTVTAGTLTVPENTFITVNGISVNTNVSTLYNYGSIHSKGNFGSWYGIMHNYGTIDIDGELSCDYHYGGSKPTLHMYEGSVLKVAGNYDTFRGCLVYGATEGTIIFDGTQQQSIGNLSSKNIIVTNPAGIRLTKDITVYGRFELNSNPLDYGTYVTHCYQNASLGADSNYGNVKIYCDFVFEDNYTANIEILNGAKVEVPEGTDIRLNGNVTVTKGSLTVPENSTLTVNGISVNTNVSTLYNYGSIHSKGNFGSWYGIMHNYGTLDIDGELSCDYHYGGSKPTLYMYEGSVLKVAGNYDTFRGCLVYGATEGTIIFDGTQQQSIGNLSSKNIIVTNPAGIRLTKDICVYGRYDLNSNPCDHGDYITKCYANASLGGDSDYGRVDIYKDYVLNESITADISVLEAANVTVAENSNITLGGNIAVNKGGLTVPSSSTLTVNGISVNTNVSTLYNYGSIHSKGNFGSWYGIMHNYGTLDIDGEFSCDYHYGGSKPTLYMYEGSVFRIAGNYDTFRGCVKHVIYGGTVVFDGTSKQTVANLGNYPTVIIENDSYEGVVFEKAITVTRLFDHKGNNFTLIKGGTFVDYDGDAMTDNYDPDPTDNQKCSVSVRNYDVMIGNASEIDHIRYASGIHESSSSIKNAEDRVDINASVIAENTANNVYTRNMPDGGVYTFWIRLTDGTTFLRVADMSQMKQRVSVDGVRITTHNLYGVKDYFIAEGDYNSYNEIKADGYIVRLTESKLGSKHDYTYTVSNPGRHTVLVRYDDTTRADEVFKVDLVVDEPTFTVNGLQVTVGNIPGVKVIRTAYGEYDTPGDTKRAAGARNFSNKAVIKDASEYTVQYREEGMITIVVEYENGYVKVFHYELAQKRPTVEQNENTVTFGDLDGLVMIRYAVGEYTTSSEIKKAAGSKTIKPDAIVDGKISVTLEAGTYTFCVQYDEDSYNYYKIVIE